MMTWNLNFFFYQMVSKGVLQNKADMFSTGHDIDITLLPITIADLFIGIIEVEI